MRAPSPQKISKCSTRHGGWLLLALFLRKNFSAVDPALHSNYAVRGFGFGEAVFDIGAERVQRQAPLQIPLRARNFGSVQAATHPHLDSFATKAQRGVYRLAHSAAEADSLFQLQCDRFRNQLGVEFGLVHFLNVNVDITSAHAFLQFLLKLVDLGALAPDDDTGTRGFDDHAQLVAGTLNLDRTDARRLELVLKLILQLDVFEQLLVVITLGKPARFPGLGVAEAKTVRMNFLSHISPI